MWSKPKKTTIQIVVTELIIYLRPDPTTYDTTKSNQDNKNKLPNTVKKIAAV
jgi:hypothetical protein